MIMKHTEKGFTIRVTSRNGKPIVTRKGFVNIEKGEYKGCNTILLDILEEKFIGVA